MSQGGRRSTSLAEPSHKKGRVECAKIRQGPRNASNPARQKVNQTAGPVGLRRIDRNPDELLIDDLRTRRLGGTWQSRPQPATVSSIQMLPTKKVLRPSRRDVGGGSTILRVQWKYITELRQTPTTTRWRHEQIVNASPGWCKPLVPGPTTGASSVVTGSTRSALGKEG